MFDVKTLVRKNILALRPYHSAREKEMNPQKIMLDANENSFGSVLQSDLHRYPDPLQRKLKAEIATLKGIPTRQIFLGNGSDEAIDLLIRIFCEPIKDSILICEPTYGMYKVCANINNVPVKSVDLTGNFHIDVKSVLQALDKTVKLIFLCSPNNPTGNLFRRNDIKILLQNFSGLIILDEAYIDFSIENSFLPELSQHSNLVVLQTFSKAWGLANIRLGMAFASPEIIELLVKVKYPYNLNGLTQQLALDALSDPYKKDLMVEYIIQEKRNLRQNLNKLSFVKRVFHSDANFLLVEVQSAHELYAYLLKQNIQVRERSHKKLCENCLRITVGTAEENKKLLNALEKYRS
jgi:histidinol-phosphate aminotransferase